MRLKEGESFVLSALSGPVIVTVFTVRIAAAPPPRPPPPPPRPPPPPPRSDRASETTWGRPWKVIAIEWAPALTGMVSPGSAGAGAAGASTPATGGGALAPRSARSPPRCSQSDQPDALAIDSHVHLRGIGTRQADGNRVFAIGREVMLDHSASPCPERHIASPVVLFISGGYFIDTHIRSEHPPRPIPIH